MRTSRIVSKFGILIFVMAGASAFGCGGSAKYDDTTGLPDSTPPVPTPTPTPAPGPDAGTDAKSARPDASPTPDASPAPDATPEVAPEAAPDITPEAAPDTKPAAKVKKIWVKEDADLKAADVLGDCLSWSKAGIDCRLVAKEEADIRVHTEDPDTCVLHDGRWLMGLATGDGNIALFTGCNRLSNGAKLNTFILRATVRHEIGHLLGLWGDSGHIPDSCDEAHLLSRDGQPICGRALMNPSVGTALIEPNILDYLLLNLVDPERTVPSDAPPARQVHKINCDPMSDGTTRVTIVGDVEDAIVAGPLAGPATYVTFGADYGGQGWTAPNPKLPACVVMADGSCKEPIVMSDEVQLFNFYVTSAASGSASGDVKWFKLADYEVGGMCAKNTVGDKLCACRSLPCICE